jgi:hemin uptake protein HemP
MQMNMEVDPCDSGLDQMSLQTRMIRNTMMPHMADKSNSPKGEGPPGPNAPGHLQGVRIVESRDLLGGGHLVVIRHEGRLYHLRRTRLGKLILTA